MFDKVQLSFSVRDKPVQCDNHRDPVLLQVGDMLFQIYDSSAQGVDVFPSQIFFGNAAVIFKSPDRSHQNNRIRSKSCHRTFDIQKLLSSKVRSEACFRDSDVGKL